MGVEDRMPQYGSVPRTLLALMPSTRYKQCEMPLQKNQCNCHHSSMSNRGRSESHALCFSSMWRIYLVALSLTVLATGVSSGALPAKKLPGRPKEFRVDVIREMQKELFKKQKTELWGKLFDEQSAAGLAGTREGGRHRRSAQEDKKVLTMEEEDRLGTFVGEVLACQNIPGLSLGMVRGGVRQALGYGVADMETARPVDEDTLFGIGSNTKAFAAATMVKLMVSLPFDKRNAAFKNVEPVYLIPRFSFTTPLAEILDDFRLPDAMRTAETTLMDVLSHRTGLGSADLGFFAGYPINMTSQDMCRRLQFLPKIVPFRTAWYYSNTMLVFVSRLCEVKTGKRWAEVVAESFWQPLQMNSTVMAPHALSLDNVARPYILRMRADDMFVEQDARLFDIHPLESAGAIMSSAADMTKWLSYLLDVIKRPSGFEMSALRQLFTERILLPSYLRQVVATETPEPILHIGYDMGFMTSYYKGSMVHWHTGDLHGYFSHLLLVPDWDTAVYVAVNGPSDPATSKALLHISYFVLELLQGRTPWVNVTLACPESYDVTPTPDPDEYDYDYHGDDAQDVNANTQVLLRPIEDYLGVFGHGLLGDLAILREQERNSLLRMELGRFLVADLIPTDDEFIFKVVARAPVADTKDWEAEHVIVFKSTGNDASTSGGSEKQKSEDNDAAKTEAKNQTEKTEKEERRVLDEVHFMWKLELFKFKKSVRFDTALEDQEHEVGGTDVEEGNGPEVSEPAPSVDRSGATAVDAFSKASILTLLFSALLVRVCSSY